MVAVLLENVDGRSVGFGETRVFCVVEGDEGSSEVLLLIKVGLWAVSPEVGLRLCCFETLVVGVLVDLRWVGICFCDDFES